MTLALWCLPVAGLLPYVATLIAKGGGRRFDNRLPRAWLAEQEGYRARANAAQLNGFEAFPLFAVAVLVAHAVRGPDPVADALAALFVVARVAYLGAYLADQARLRSAVWFVGLGAAVAIFLSAAR
jgi:uncharacterized MAPEG superfamily protein